MTSLCKRYESTFSGIHLIQIQVLDELPGIVRLLCLGLFKQELYLSELLPLRFVSRIIPERNQSFEPYFFLV